MNYKITETVEIDGEYHIEIKDFLSDFPFENYVILRDVNHLSRTIM